MAIKTTINHEICETGVVSLPAAAKLLGISLRMLQEMVQNREIDYTSVRSKRLIARQTITDYLAGRLVKARN